MKKLLFSEVLRSISANIDYQNDFVVSGVCTDTRSLNKGDLYIALSGDNYDGNDFIGVAVEKGACAVICGRPANAGIPVIQVSDTLKAFQSLAAYYRTKFDIPVIAVTGSNGKTTTKNMLSAVLSSKYKVYFSDRNYNNEIGLPRSILELDDSHDIAVLEMGMNHLGEIETLSAIAKPTIAVITNIGKAHIGNLSSVENILSAKLEVLTGLVSGGLVVLNGDDPFLTKLELKGYNTALIGTAEDNRFEIRGTDILADKSPSTFTVISGTETYPCTMPAIGKHNVTNALLAICTAQHLGVDIQSSASELRRYTVSPMRLEISEIKGITIIKDYYNSSPESAHAALEILNNYNKNGRKISILSEMNELGVYSFKEHTALAKECAEKTDDVFFIGKSFTAFSDILKRDNRFFNKNENTLLLSALYSLINSEAVNAGDVILIKGSRSYKMEELYELLKTYINGAKSDFSPLPQSTAKLYVDINAVKYNFSQIKNKVGPNVEIMPMVKANAYGSGTDVVANVFRDSRYLAVADTKEAALIRRVLPEANIVIIYQPLPSDIPEIVTRGYIPAVSDLSFAAALNAEAKRQGKTALIHLEVDTGSGRLGIPADKCKSFGEGLKALGNVIPDGIFMHYICADSLDPSDIEFTARQTMLFKQATADMESVTGKIPLKHACSGAAIFNDNADHFDMVRPGYMLYGYYADSFLRERVSLKPALKFTSAVLQIHQFPAGTPISYNRQFTTTRDSLIATVSVGYSDGIFRSLYKKTNEKNGHFVVNGQRAPIVGTICMDLTMIDITDIKGDVGIGTEVAIFDNINVTIEEMAEISGTIGYEVISKIEDKADRVECF